MNVSNEDRERLRKLLLSNMAEIKKSTTLVEADVDMILQCLQPVTVDFSDWQKVLDPVQTLPYKPIDVWYGDGYPTVTKPSCYTNSAKATDCKSNCKPKKLKPVDDLKYQRTFKSPNGSVTFLDAEN